MMRWILGVGLLADLMWGGWTLRDGLPSTGMGMMVVGLQGFMPIVSFFAGRTVLAALKQPDVLPPT